MFALSLLRSIACDYSGVYELMIYHDGPDNSTGTREILPLGLPELKLNFTWHDWGHFAATKSFLDPVKNRRIISGWAFS